MDIDEQLLRELKKLSGSKTIIVGIGNTLKGDDGAGPLICEKLKSAGISAEVIDAGTVPENYIQPIIKKAPQNLLLIDAMDFGASPGTIQIFETENLSSSVVSTHALSPRLFAEVVCRSIKAHPVRNSTNGSEASEKTVSNGVNIYFIGIQPAQIGLGQAVSGLVSQAVEQLCHVLTEIFPPQPRP